MFKEYQNKSDKLVIVTAGLPGAGKTFLSQKLSRYLSWIGREAKVFTVSTYRSKVTSESLGQEFFNPQRKESSEIRTKSSALAMADLIQYLKRGGHVGILDGSNISYNRRVWLKHLVK